MRAIINYIRSCFCKHDFELLAKVTTKDPFYGNKPIGHKHVYRCKCCGYVQRVRL